jgi:protein AFG1
VLSLCQYQFDILSSPNSAQNNEKLKSTFDKFAKDDSEVVMCKELTFLGRKLVVNKAAGSIAYFNFSDLCDEPLSSADYIELCRHFNTIFIQDIPKITQLMRSQARRFITLVDTLYDHKIRIVCTASESPDRLFQTDSFNHRTNDYTRTLMDDLDINQTDAESHSIFTGEEEAFAFERTVSRLLEMQTCEYWSSDKINRNIH